MATTKDDFNLTPTTTTRSTRSTAPKSGSVWESRIKLDQGKGGIKVFNHDDDVLNSDDTTATTTNNTDEVDKKQKQSPVSAKRKTWKSSDIVTSSDLSPVRFARQLRSELSDEQVDLRKNQVVEMRKTRSAVRSGNGSESSDKSELLRKLKSDSVLVSENSGEIGKGLIPKSRSDEEFGVCEEKAMNTENVDRVETRLDGDVNVVDGVKMGEEINVIEKKSVGDDDDVKEVNLQEKKECGDVKEVNLQEKKASRIVVEKKKWTQSNERPVPFSSSKTVKKQQAAPVVVNHVRVDPAPLKTKPVEIVSEHFPASPRRRTHSTLQNFVDLVMWRDMARSAFVFGIGTFLIISSSFTKDLNISFISVVSYLGLVYLAGIFLFQTFAKRASSDIGKTDQDYVFGEEEAIRLVKLILPFVNEFLLNLRALFSGDPATTMKLAVLLFVLARCGGSITIWKMSKLGFFGVFTVPKICSAYSTQLTAYGKFWIRRFKDAWESCTYKKAIGFAIFTLVWNLSSVVARIWAVFMLFVAFKYYQQSLIREGCSQQEATINGTSWQPGQNIGGRRKTAFTSETQKQKKPC